MNILEYVDAVGDFTFEEKRFNEADNLVFCSLLYLEYSCTSINNYEHTLGFIGKQFLSKNSYRSVKKLMAQKTAYKLLRKVIKKRRYKDIIIHDYIYSCNIDKQFCAVMYRINKGLEYICFEGTDEMLSGWKEDFALSYKFPVPSQEDAIKYANKHIKLKGPNIIMGGHSKGGNLALVAGMYTNILKQHKIKRIYSFDGPGLRSEEFNSREYKRIKKKYMHFIVDYSVFGVLLRNDIHGVVQTTKKNFFAHELSNWVVDENGIVKSIQSPSSADLMKSSREWLDSHSDIDKENVVKIIFGIFEECEIKKLYEIYSFSNIRKLIVNMKNIDEYTKKVVIDMIKYNFFNKKNK